MFFVCSRKISTFTRHLRKPRPAFQRFFTMNCQGDQCSVSAPVKHATPVGSFTLPEATNGKQQLVLDIISDVVCPWCYIGSRRMHKALTEVDTSKVDVHIRWHPYQLNPTAPTYPNSEDKMEMYNKKFGEARVKQMFPNVINAARSEGIDLKFGGKTGNTMLAHKLLHYVAEHYGYTAQDTAMNAVFKTYFEDNDDVTDPEVVIKAIAGTNIATPEELRAAVTDKAAEASVKSSLQTALTYAQGGVPLFIIGSSEASRRYSLSGAQEPDTFLQAFHALKIWVTIEVNDVKPSKVEITESNILFNGSAKTTEYVLDLPLANKIDAEKSVYAVKDRGVEFRLIKAESGYWNKVTPDQSKFKGYIKVDWDLYKDEDDSDDEKNPGEDFGTGGIDWASMMGGMGGMPGMEGMGGMDLASMLGGMGGMGGMPGMEGMEGMDFSKMDFSQFANMGAGAAEGEHVHGEHCNHDHDGDDEKVETIEQ